MRQWICIGFIYFVQLGEERLERYAPAASGRIQRRRCGCVWVRVGADLPRFLALFAVLRSG